MNDNSQQKEKQNPKAAEPKAVEPTKAQEPVAADANAEKDKKIASLKIENRRLAVANESCANRIKAIQRVTERYATANLTLTETMGDMRSEIHDLRNENAQLRGQLAEYEAQIANLTQQLAANPAAK